MTKIFFHGFIVRMKTDKISFGANPLNRIKIKKYNSIEKRFENYPVRFVRLENKYSDISVVDRAAVEWEDAKYIKRIASSSHWMNIRDDVEIDVYALTTQQNNFDELIFDKILGFAEIRNDANNRKKRILNRLQVRPDAINLGNPHNKKFKHIGCSILKSLKKIYNNLHLESENILTDEFYMANGFIQDNVRYGSFEWQSNIFKRLYLRYKYSRGMLGY